MLQIKHLSILVNATLALSEYLPDNAKVTHIEMEDGSGNCFNCIVERTRHEKTMTRKEFFVMKNGIIVGNNVIEIID